MIRPITQLHLLLKADASSARGQDASNQFLIFNLGLGACVGILFAALMLLTDTLGFLTLIKSQPYPVTTTLVFMLLSILKFTPLVLATAVGLAARRT